MTLYYLTLVLILKANGAFSFVVRSELYGACYFSSFHVSGQTINLSSFNDISAAQSRITENCSFSSTNRPSQQQTKGKEVTTLLTFLVLLFVIADLFLWIFYFYKKNSMLTVKVQSLKLMHFKLLLFALSIFCVFSVFCSELGMVGIC